MLKEGEVGVVQGGVGHTDPKKEWTLHIGMGISCLKTRDR